MLGRGLVVVEPREAARLGRWGVECVVGCVEAADQGFLAVREGRRAGAGTDTDEDAARRIEKGLMGQPELREGREGWGRRGRRRGGGTQKLGLRKKSYFVTEFKIPARALTSDALARRARACRHVLLILLDLI